EQEKWLSKILQTALNGFMYFVSMALLVFGAYQVVLMCYLYLLGPITAAFFAWPSLTSNNRLFRTVFGNWLNAVITVSLWRFYWMVILALMTQRIIYLMESGGGNMDLQW